MESKEQAGKGGGEVSMYEKRIANGGDAVIIIPNEETPRTSVDSKPLQGSETFGPRPSRPNSPQWESGAGGGGGGLPKSGPKSCPSPEISGFTPSLNKPPKIPTNNENLLRKRSLSRSVYSKPKSRFGEQPYPLDASIIDEDGVTLQEQISRASPCRNSLNRGSPRIRSDSARTNSIKPETPFAASSVGPAEDDDDNEEEIYKKIKSSSWKYKKVRAMIVIEWMAFLCISVSLIGSLTVEKLKKTLLWGLEVWKWCVLVMVIFSGMLITNWFMHFVVFLIERNFLLRKKVLYFVHGLKKSVQVFIWIGLVLLAWTCLVNRGFEQSERASKILKYVTWTLISLLIGSFLWLLKTLLLKILASNFHVKAFFDRIQESVFHQYVLQTLSGRALIEEAVRDGKEPSTGELRFRNGKKGKGPKDKKVIDMGKFHRMKQEKVSAWTMKVLVDAVASSGLSTISKALEESVNDGEGEQTDQEITNEIEATAAAYHIFRNVAQPGSKYIEEEDLLRFMIKEEVDLVWPLFEGYETGRIDRKALIDWVVKVYNGRKALAHALNDTKTAVNQLNKLVTGIIVVVTILIWLLVLKIATTEILVFLTSQLVAAAFLFGNTCKTIFEAIIFVFVMHPFDVGDRCVIDGVQLLVEEMNILTTVFLKLDNEKVYYPNSVLATKPISNYYRSPDMGDKVEFSIDFATPVEKIALLKDEIRKCLERNPQHWHPNHSVVVKEIENVNKLKMGLYCNHTMNFQDFGEKTRRRTELVIEIKKIFEELNIKYYLLTQQVHLRHMGSESAYVT